MNRLKNKKHPKLRAARMSVLVVVAVCLVGAIVTEGAMIAKKVDKIDRASAANTVAKRTTATKQVAPEQTAIKSEAAKTLNSDIAMGNCTSAEALSVSSGKSELAVSVMNSTSESTKKSKKSDKAKKDKKSKKAKKANKSKRSGKTMKAKKATATLKATWYTGDVLGFRGSGGALEHGESIALNNSQRQSLGLKYGQKVYLKFPGSFKKLSGWYKIKDSGCANGIVDMFYKSRGSVPSNFKSAGVVRSVKLYKETKKKKKLVGEIVSE